MPRSYLDVFTLKSDFTEEELWNAYKFKYKFALTIIDKKQLFRKIKCIFSRS